MHPDQVRSRTSAEADGRAEPINSQTTPKMAVGAQRTRWASITTAAANVASTTVSVNACTPKYSNDPKCHGQLGTRVPRGLKQNDNKGLAKDQKYVGKEKREEYRREH